MEKLPGIVGELVSFPWSGKAASMECHQGGMCHQTQGGLLCYFTVSHEVLKKRLEGLLEAETLQQFQIHKVATTTKTLIRTG